VLPASPTAPCLAREVLRRWACPNHRTDPDDALLLVSELVTNAVIHGAPPIGLAMRYAGGETLVRVTDTGHQPIPLPHPPALDAQSGRGLRLLEVLATDWGVDTDVHGTTVWFTL
jgi:anti-sigma regulatory factor (Ser/Thr protein kinase)